MRPRCALRGAYSREEKGASATSPCASFDLRPVRDTTDPDEKCGSAIVKLAADRGAWGRRWSEDDSDDARPV